MASGPHFNPSTMKTCLGTVILSCFAYSHLQAWLRWKNSQTMLNQIKHSVHQVLKNSRAQQERNACLLYTFRKSTLSLSEMVYFKWIYWQKRGINGTKKNLRQSLLQTFSETWVLKIHGPKQRTAACLLLLNTVYFKIQPFTYFSDIAIFV